MTSTTAKSSLRIAVDVSHTSHTRSNTGIQRVTRSLAAHLTTHANAVLEVTYDPFNLVWRELSPLEQSFLHPDSMALPTARRRPRWPWRQRFLGELRRVARRDPLGVFFRGEGVDCIVFPEIFSALIGEQIHTMGVDGRLPRIAIFHDAIAWKFPQWSPEKTVAYYPAYLDSLVKMDGIASVSQSSLDDLFSYWTTRGFPESEWPRCRVISLGATAVQAGKCRGAANAIPVFLSVATLEPRKNHRALLAAASQLWAEGYQFKLRLIGGSRRDGSADLEASIDRLIGQGLPLEWMGVVSDAAVDAAYADADLVVYPSLYEGYGLPVVEALSHGKPVLMTPHGSLSELEAGGGCRVLRSASAASVAEGLRFLLDSPDAFRTLTEEALHRPVRSWDVYAHDIAAFALECSALFEQKKAD